MVKMVKTVQTVIYKVFNKLKLCTGMSFKNFTTVKCLQQGIDVSYSPFYRAKQL